MHFTAEMAGDKVLLHVHFLDMDDSREAELVQFASGQGWRRVDMKGRTIGITVRLWRDADPRELGRAFAQELSGEVGQPQSSAAVAGLQAFAARIDRFGSCIPKVA